MRRLTLAPLLLVLAACGGGDARAPLASGTEIDLPTHPEWEDGMAMEVAGIVEFDERTNCVYLYSEPDDYRHLIVWPAGTHAIRDPFLVVLEDGREIRAGDHVEGSGGGYAVDPAPPEQCLARADGATAFNWQDDMVVSAADPQEGEGTALPVPAHQTGSEFGFNAEIIGAVEFEEDTGCVVLVIDKYRYPAIWPVGTVARRDPFRIVLPGGEVARAGDTVRGGGSYPSTTDGGPDPVAMGVPPECLEGPRRTPWKEAASFNPSGEIEVVAP